MGRLAAFLAVAALCAPALAHADPIEERMGIMKGVGDAFGDVGKMNKGDLPYDQAKVTLALDRIIDASKKMPTLFPEDSKTGHDTEALPKIWTDRDDFNARFAKLGADAQTAKSKIVDLASLKETYASVGRDCGGCHELYRAKK